MNFKKDYYAILGVSPSAEDIVIRAAYKALAQRYHPDRAGGPQENMTLRMAEINEAYAVLSDPEKRREYAGLRAHGTQSDDAYFTEQADDIPSRVPSGAGPAISGIKWLKFWTYFSLPVGGVVCIFLFFELSTAHYSYFWLWLSYLHFYLAYGLHQRRLWAWRWNWVMLVATWIGGSIPDFSGATLDFLTNFYVVFLIFGVLWMWPNYVYWKKRQFLFSGAVSRNIASRGSSDQEPISWTLLLFSWFLSLIAIAIALPILVPAKDFLPSLPQSVWLTVLAILSAILTWSIYKLPWRIKS